MMSGRNVMKRDFAIVVALVAIALALSTGLAHAQASSTQYESAAIPIGTTSVSFNGFCDGATITYSGSGSLISGTHDNWNCAGGETFIAGVLGRDLKIAPGEGTWPATVANMADNVGVLGLSNGALQLYLDFAKDTFSIYKETDGVSSERLVNQGEFKIVRRHVSSCRGRMAAWQGPVVKYNPAPNPGSAYPSGTYDINFDCYCDFLHLTTYGNRVGGIHDFSACGDSDAAVAANDSILAADADGTAGASLVATDNEFNIINGLDCATNFYLNFATSTWSVYLAGPDCGFFLGNSGTFTFVQNGPAVEPGLVGLPTTTRP
jgi:hypothetical protein